MSLTSKNFWQGSPQSSGWNLLICLAGLLVAAPTWAVVPAVSDCSATRLREAGDQDSRCIPPHHFAQSAAQPWAGTRQAEPLALGESELGIGRSQEMPERSAPPVTKPTLPEQPEIPQQPGIPETPEMSTPIAPEISPADAPASDDLGDFILKEQEISPPPTQQPRLKSVFLLGRIDYFRSSNVFSGIDPIDDALLRTGLSLVANPQIGPRTYLITGIDSNLVRYVDQTAANYDELRIRAGVLHQLSSRMVGEIGWTNQQLSAAETRLLPPYNGDRFLRENSLRLELSRQDPLAKNLTLNTFYQLQVSFAEPSDRTRLINFFYTSLSYNIQPQLELGLDYQLGVTSFLRQDRTDQSHQLSTRLTYYLSKATVLSAFAGFSFGSSSLSILDFEGAAFGINLSVNLPLF